MADDSDNGQQQSQTGSQNQSSTAWGGKGGGQSNRKLLYILVGIAVIVVIAIVALSAIGPSYPTINQTQSKNTTEIAMPASQAQLVLNSLLSYYNVSDLFNPASPINVSSLSAVVPALATNVTSGWVTVAAGQNTTTNATLEFIVLTTNNTQSMSKMLGSEVVASLNGSVESGSASGTYNGLAYNYALFSNSTGNVQLVYGWKGSNVAVALANFNAGYEANATQLIWAVANATTYN